MKIIIETEYAELRDLYRLTFIREDWNPNNNNGYFWEGLKQYHRRSENYCFERIKAQKDDIYVMWDSLENFEIQNENYWKYPAKSMLRLSVNEFFQLFVTLPEDIYVFDDSLKWSVILTHEDVFDKKRYCLSIP